MSIPNWMKELTRWQSASKTPLGIHTRHLKDPVHRESAYGKRYYFQIDANQIYFTQREMEVALLLLQGLTYKGIGEVLGITGRTIECSKTSSAAITANPARYHQPKPGNAQGKIASVRMLTR